MTDHEIKTQWATTERVLVGFDDRPQSRSILRDAWRLAHGMHADLIAVSIQQSGYPALLHIIGSFLKYGSKARAIREERLRHIEEYATLAEDLGAEVIRRTSPDIAATIADIAHDRHVTQIVLGQPAHSRWEVLLYGSVTNRVLRLNRDVDIHLVPLNRKKAHS